VGHPGSPRAEGHSRGTGCRRRQRDSYQPWAAAKKKENFENRATADPESKCYLPGVPRLTYMPFPFQIVQTPRDLVLLHEYVHAVRTIHTDGSAHPSGPFEWWLGDARGHWEGDTLVVDLVQFNDRTWFDRAGNFHSDALHVVERFTLTDPDHIDYVVTIEDPNVFTKPWTMRMILYRHKERLPDPGYGATPSTTSPIRAEPSRSSARRSGVVAAEPSWWRAALDAVAYARAGRGARSGHREDARWARRFQGFWTAKVGGTYDLTDPRGGEIRVEEVAREAKGLVRQPNRSRVVDPPDGKIPYQPWAAAKSGDLRAHADNPTKPEHIDTQNRCLPDGPMRDLLHGGFRILQVPGYVLFLGEENYGYRAIPLDGRPHLGSDVKLWMGDSRGRWDGDTLVIDVTNLNGKPRTRYGQGVYGAPDAHFVERLKLVGPTPSTTKRPSTLPACIRGHGNGGSLQARSWQRLRAPRRRLSRGRAERGENADPRRRRHEKPKP
jgi:hypothetical protein